MPSPHSSVLKGNPQNYDTPLLGDCDCYMMSQNIVVYDGEALSPQEPSQIPLKSDLLTPPCNRVTYKDLSIPDHQRTRDFSEGQAVGIRNPQKQLSRTSCGVK